MTTRRPNAALRLLLALVDRAAHVVPPSRRRGWRRQWRADLTYAWRQGRGRHGLTALPYVGGSILGVLRHAFWLRGHVRRVEMISHDLRYGWRLMLRRPGFTAVAVLTLGLGIGATVTIDSWLEALVLRPIAGVADVGRFVAVNNTAGARHDLSVSWPDFMDIRARRPDSVEGVLAYDMAALNLLADGEPRRVWGQLVTDNYFDLLGVTPALGRGFLPEEDRSAAAPVAVFSYGYWKNRMGGDPGIIGRAVTLNGRSFTVVGITPPGFRGNVAGLAFDVWVPVTLQPFVTAGNRLDRRGNRWLQMMAKLAPGVSLARAQGDFDVIARSLSATYADDAGHGLRLTPLWRAPGTASAILLPVFSVLMGVVLVVLLIACANVAGLLLARAAGRQRETAVRLALGASRMRIVGQLLTESALLAAGGGAVGVLVSYWTAGLLGAFFPPAQLPLALDGRLNGPVLSFAVVLTVVTVALFGLAPALEGSRAPLALALREAGASVTAGPRRARLRAILVIAQVALSLILLVSAGLFLQTLRHAAALNPGFSLRDGLLASIDLLPAGYDAPRGTALFRDLLAQVRRLPDVRAASLTQYVPLGLDGSSDFYADVDGYAPAKDEQISVYYDRVGPGYFETMGIRLLAGRGIADQDTPERSDVGVINETMARRYWGGRNPLGGVIHFGSRTIEVVGVAADGKYGSLTEPARNYLYLPVQQWYRPTMVLVVKTAGSPLGALGAVRAAVRRLDPNLPLFDVETMEDHLDVSLFLQRLAADLLGGFGVVALLLSTIGLYGVIAAAVAQRTPEIGMRMALGATRAGIVRLVLRQGLLVTGIGVGLGLAGALAVTPLFRSQLVGVSTTDLGSFAVTSVLLIAVALAAAYLPARRAASIDPLEALRQE